MESLAARGSRIEQLEVPRDAENVLTGITPARPLEVLEVQGDWVKAKVPTLPHGPVWIDFEQVIYFRTMEMRD